MLTAAVQIWNARYALLNQLTHVPRVLSHGDYNLGNLIAQGKGTVVFDWGSMGLSPVGSDLAQLALSFLTDPFTCYFDAVRGTCLEQDMLLGY